MENKEPVGQELAKARTYRGLSQAQLSELLGYSRDTIASWEVGKTLPSRDELIKIKEVLGLRNEYLAYLIELAGYESYPIDTQAPSTKLSEQVNNPEAIRDIQVQVKDIQDSMKALSRKIEGKSTVGYGEMPLAISEEIQNALDAVNRLQTTSREITAPVTLPSSDDLTVNLVPASFLERLEEYRSEESKWLTGLGVFIGAILGILINVATGGNMSIQAWVILTVFLSMAFLTGWSAWSYRKRGNKLKNQLLVNQSSRNKMKISEGDDAT